MKIEFVGGPLCGESREVTAMPSSIDAMHRVPPKEWVVSYRRTGVKLRSSSAYRYDFAGQRLLAHSA